MKINKKFSILWAGLSVFAVSAAGVVIGEGVKLGIDIDANKVIPPVVIEYIDETGEDVEGLKDNILEAEDAVFEGKSSNGKDQLDHACPARSLLFNKDYSGSMAVANIFSNDAKEKNKIIFNVTSDKNVECKMDVFFSCPSPTIADFESKNRFTDFLKVSVNKRVVKYDKTLNSDKGVYQIISATPTIKLKEGENTIVLETLKFNTHWKSVVDAINIHTTATIGFEKTIWKNYNVEVTSVPTLERGGKGEIVCKKCNTRLPNVILPSLKEGMDSGFYIGVKDTEDPEATNYYLSINKDIYVGTYPLKKVAQHKLTIQSDYVKFENGTNQMEHWEGWELPLYTENHPEYKVSRWFDVTNPNEVFLPNEFAMPKRDCVIAPIFEPREVLHCFEKPRSGGIDFFAIATPNEVTYKPFHSNTSTLKGFDRKTLVSKVKHSPVKRDDLIIDGASVNYGNVSSGWSFVICNDIFTYKNNHGEMEYTLENQGKDTLHMLVTNTNSSGGAFSKSIPQKEVTLLPGEHIVFRLSMDHIKNENTLSGVKFLDNASELHLGIAQYYHLLNK